MKGAKARSSLVFKKMRLHPEFLHAPRATRQHAHPSPPEAHRPYATAAPAGRGLGTLAPSPGPPPPSCCMTSARVHVQGQDWNVYHLGFGGIGLPWHLPSRPGSFWPNPTCEEARGPWNLRNPTWLVGKAQGMGQKTKMAGGGLADCNSETSH